MTNVWGFFLNERHNPFAVKVFVKAMYLFVLLQLMYLGPIADIMGIKELLITAPLIKLFFLPTAIAVTNIHVFYGLAIVVLMLGVLLPNNYIISLLFFWLCFNIYRVNFSVINGVQLILIIISFWSIPLVDKFFNKGKMKYLQIGAFNAAILLIQLQIVFIYLISGIDKATSPVWRTGEALDYIMNLDVMFNPALSIFLKNEFVRIIISWIVIAFELCFGIFVYIKRTKLWILCAGVVFHVAIWVAVSLPDFALLMMTMYLIFLEDSDYQYLKRKFLSYNFYKSFVV